MLLVICPFLLNFDRNFTFYLNFDYNTRFEIQADLSQKACIWSLILELSPVSKDEWNQKCSISLKLLFPLIKSKYLKCLPRISYFAQIIIFLLYFFHCLLIISEQRLTKAFRGITRAFIVRLKPLSLSRKGLLPDPVTT